MKLSFGVLLGFLHQAIQETKDPRQASNGKRYSLKDVVLASFSVFFMQCESFLEHQRQMQSRRGRDNAQTLSNSRNTPSVYTVGMDSEAIERFDAAKIANKLTSFTG